MFVFNNIDSSANINYHVLGDPIVDRYLFGLSLRKNLENVDSPIFDVYDTKYCQGGAANVANILGHVGINFFKYKNTTFYCIISKSDFKRFSFIKKYFDMVCSVLDSDEPLIPIKTRIIDMCDQRYICRFDEEKTFKYSVIDSTSYKNLNNVFLSHYSHLKNTVFNTLVISDYNKNFLNDDFVLDDMNFIIGNIRPKVFYRWSKVLNFITVNMKEFEELIGSKITDKGVEFNQLIDEFLLKYKLFGIIVTDGRNGLYGKIAGNTLFHVKMLKPLDVPCHHVIGAGDCVLVYAAILLSSYLVKSKIKIYIDDSLFLNILKDIVFLTYVTIKVGERLITQDFIEKNIVLSHALECYAMYDRSQVWKKVV